MGVQDIPGCFEGALCDKINWAVRKGAYLNIAQEHIGPAGYFRDPKEMRRYKKHSVFLPELNNEVSHDMSEQNKARFSALEGAMLVMFSEDTVVYPNESEWF